MEIFKLFGSIFVDTDAADKSMQKTEKNVENIATKLTNGVKTAAKWGAGITNAAVGVVTAVSGAFVVATETTRDYRNEITKLETAFGSAGFSADEAHEIYSDLNAVLGETDQAVETANHLAKLCDTQEELSVWTDICTGVYATFGASLPIEGLTEASNETAKVGKLTGSLADALNWAGVNEDVFQERLDQCNTEQERQALITETLNELYKETAENFRVNNKEILDANKAQDKLNETMAKIGEKLEPIVTDIKNYGATLLEEVIPPIVDFVEKHDLVQVTLDRVKGAIEFLKEGIDFLKESYQRVIDSVDDLSKAWENASKWAEEHRDGLNILVIMLGALTTAILAYNSAKIVKKALDIVETAQIWLLIAAENAQTIATTAATTATSAFSAVMAFLTSPITLVIAAIGALIAIGVLLYENWDVIKEKALVLWENAKEGFENLKTGILNIFENIKSAISTAWEFINNCVQVGILFIVEIVKAAFELITLPFSFIWENCKEIIISVWDAIKELVTTALNAIKDKITITWDAVKTVFTTVWDAISAAMSKVWNDIKSVITNTLNTIESVISNIWEAIRLATSTVWNAIKTVTISAWDNIKIVIANAINNVKTTISSGLDSAKNTVSNVLRSIKEKFSDIFEDAKSIVKNGIDAITGFFNNISWSLPHIKLPHFSISGSFSLDPPSVPSFGIDWYKKAMDNPMIMNSPTIFGYNTATGQLMGGGEAGSEVVSGTNTLMNMIQNAVANQNGELITVLWKILDAIISMDENMGGNLREALNNTAFKVNGREFARLVKAVN